MIENNATATLHAASQKYVGHKVRVNRSTIWMSSESSVIMRTHILNNKVVPITLKKL